MVTIGSPKRIFRKLSRVCGKHRNFCLTVTFQIADVAFEVTDGAKSLHWVDPKLVHGAFVGQPRKQSPQQRPKFARLGSAGQAKPICCSKSCISSKHQGFWPFHPNHFARNSFEGSRSAGSLTSSFSRLAKSSCHFSGRSALASVFSSDVPTSMEIGGAFSMSRTQPWNKVSIFAWSAVSLLRFKAAK